MDPEQERRKLKADLNRLQGELLGSGATEMEAKILVSVAALTNSVRNLQAKQTGILRRLSMIDKTHRRFAESLKNLDNLYSAMKKGVKKVAKKSRRNRK